MVRLGLWVLVTILSVALLAQMAATQPLDAQAALARLFAAERISSDWFAPEFLAAVPLSRVEQVIADFKRVYGGFQRVEPAGEGYLVVLERAVVQARIALDPAGRITGLLFSQVRARVASLEQAVQELRELPGRVGLLVLEDGRERAAHNPAVPLAVGSAFKLAVLAALNDQIVAGRRSWGDVVALRPEWKSLPSGILQDWPAGSPFTLHTLASLMIARSDNTATDTLIHVMGREAVEIAAAPRNRPLLTTREAFTLKDPRNQDLLDRYRNGDEAARRALLGELQRRPLPSPEEMNAAFARGPLAIDVEWFFSARELCAVMGRVASLPLMSIEPGIASRRDWARVAFKGGSEPGVLNLTSLLEDSQRRTFCVTLTWNDEARAAEARLSGLYGGIIALLR